MPTTVYRNMTGKNANQGTYQPMRSSMGMKNSIHVNPAALALTSPAGDQMGCFSHSTDVYMRNANRNTIDTEKTNCSTKQPFHRESQLEGGRASTFAQYANAQVGHPRPIYGASMEHMKYKPMMEQMHPMMMKEQMYHMPMMENYRRRRENFAPDKKKVIMGRMTEGYKPKKEFFTNRCGMR